MYLKRLEIQGFKSFADKVELEFNQGITAVVGPNGCGKSNIVDAIRWVLGEQSAKTLRGSRMDDIIFAGSNNRRPIGMAQVSLTLDNSTGIFPLDFNEVTVSRRLYRSGESEYLINKVTCRMKDIHELFMDTGIGKDGFSVIGQGRVDEILSLKAEDRRMLIEEAAGIVKYRYRKQEAEKKLSNTEQSLIRINDLLTELNEQLGPLEVQAQKALEYQKLKSELDKWEISLLVQNIKENKRKEQEFRNTTQELEDKFTQVNTEYHQLENHIEKNRLELQSLEQKISQMQKNYYDANSELERQEHQIAMAEERETGLFAQIKRINGERANLEQEKNNLISNITKNKEELILLKQKYENSSAIVGELTNKINEQKAKITSNTSKIENYKSQLIDYLQEKAQINNEINKLNSEMNLQEKQLHQFENKLKNLQITLQKKEKEIAELKKKKNTLSQEKNSVEIELDDIEKKLADNIENQKHLKKFLEEKQYNFQQIKSRLQVMREMEESGDGYQQGVKAIIEEKRKNKDGFAGVIGTVADVITVPKHLEKAIETALGGSLQNLITIDDHEAQIAIDFLKKNKKGRATFLPLNTIKSTNSNVQLKGSSVLGKAVDLIEFAPQYQEIMNYLLGRVWVIKDLSSAVTIGKKYNFNVRMVTLEGDIISPGGALTGGNYSRQKPGLLARKRLIGELSEKVKEIESEINNYYELLTKQESEQKKYSEEISQLKDLLQSKDLEIMKIDNYHQQTLKEINRIKSDEQLLIFEKEEAQQEIGKLIEQREQFYLKIKETTEKHNYLQEQIKIIEADLQKITDTHEKLISQLNEEKINLATLKQAYDLGQKNLDELQQRLNQIIKGEQKLQWETEELQKKIEELQLIRIKADDIIKDLSKNLVKFEEDITLHKEQKQYVQEKIISLESTVKEKQDILNKIKNEKFQIEMKLARIQMAINQNEDKLFQQYNYTLEKAQEIMLNVTNRRNVQNRIEELNNRIQQLGQVNFAAISEYERLNNRVIFLTKQYTDLQEAKISLSKVIKEMDQIMSKKFKETFSLVNEAFNKVFIDIFGGGSARLDLTDDNSLLDTGIEITAQPPGKKPQSLSLLSGGERAMTAIALLFAILEVKPTPFCILDEIEAALDEANAIKFAQFIKKYSPRTQFIVISHRKPTMEAADILYGVTMENSGVSKLISVRLSDIENISKVS